LADKPPTPDVFDTKSLRDTLPDKIFVLPHVILCISLEADQMLDVKSFDQWLKQLPAHAQYAKIQGIYHGYSTLVLLALPVVLWNMLPDTLYCNFVSYTKSVNLLNLLQPAKHLDSGIGIKQPLKQRKEPKYDQVPTSLRSRFHG